MLPPAFFGISLAANLSDLPPIPVSESAIIEMARQRSSNDCSAPQRRCSYRASAGEDGWWVTVVLSMIDEDGREGYSIDAQWAYHYSLDGKYLDVMKGL